jgi:hypothetical protein
MTVPELLDKRIHKTLFGGKGLSSIRVAPVLFGKSGK